MPFSSKRAYKVRIKGYPILLRKAKEDATEQYGGFYTTRFLIADDDADARRRAMEFVNSKAKDWPFDLADRPIELVVDACTTLEGIVVQHAEGFSLWVEAEYHSL